MVRPSFCVVVLVSPAFGPFRDDGVFLSEKGIERYLFLILSAAFASASNRLGLGLGNNSIVFFTQFGSNVECHLVAGHRNDLAELSVKHIVEGIGCGVRVVLNKVFCAGNPLFAAFSQLIFFVKELAPALKKTLSSDIM
jgi:hypothetical protein